MFIDKHDSMTHWDYLGSSKNICLSISVLFPASAAIQMREAFTQKYPQELDFLKLEAFWALSVVIYQTEIYTFILKIRGTSKPITIWSHGCLLTKKSWVQFQLPPVLSS